MTKFSDRIYTGETFYDYPVPQDGVTSGSISAENVSASVQIDNVIVGGSVTFPTITITLRGIPVPGPLVAPTAKSVGQTFFLFRGRQWRLLSVSTGPRFYIAGEPRFMEWSCTGVDTTRQNISIG